MEQERWGDSLSPEDSTWTLLVVGYEFTVGWSSSLLEAAIRLEAFFSMNLQ